MAYRNTGDAPGRGRKTQGIEWMDRKTNKESYSINFDADVLDEIKAYCNEHETSLSQLIKHLLQKEIRR